MASYYDLLNVATEASYEQIKVSYKRLALEVHPDRHPGQERVYTVKFQKLFEAYTVLTTPHLRRLYDETLFRSSSKTSSEDRPGSPPRSFTVLYDGLPTKIGIWHHGVTISSLYYHTEWARVDLPEKFRESILKMFDQYPITTIQSIRVGFVDTVQILEVRILVTIDVLKADKHAFHLFM